MENNLFKKFDYYWIFLIFTIVLCYGFFLTNHSMGIDDEILPVFANPHVILITNRIGNFIFSHLLQTYEYLPFWREFLGIALYAVGITLHLENFMMYLGTKFDKKAATIFAVSAISFPYLAFHFLFMENMLQHGFIMITTAFAVKFLYKFISEKSKKRNVFISVLFLFFAASVYESAIYYFVISCLFIEFYKLVDKSQKQTYISVFLIGILSFIAVFINAILSSIFKELSGIIHSKSDLFLLYDFSSINDFFNSFICSMEEFFRIFTDSAVYNFGTMISIILIIAFIIYSVTFSVRQKNINIFLYSIFIILVPFASLIILGNPGMPFRSYATLSFLNAMVLSLLYISFKDRKILLNILISFIAITVVYQSQELNQIFYTENLKFENDKNFAYAIVHDLRRLELIEKPIIFLGTRENPKLKHNYEESNEVNISSFNWDRYDSFEGEIFVSRPYGFLRELGLEVKDYSYIRMSAVAEYDQLLVELKENVRQMNVYPKEDSIRDIGEYVIVKIGPSKADIE